MSRLVTPPDVRDLLRAQGVPETLTPEQAVALARLLHIEQCAPKKIA